MNKLVFGLQWGDEGKAKIVDILSKDADFIVRYQGGANAGHTVVTDKKKFIFHLVPSGLLYKQTRGILGAGMVIDIPGLVEEIENLEKNGLEIWPRLIISPRAHLVLQYHKYQDVLEDEQKGIGTTSKGIGPTYEDKAARRGLRAADLLDTKKFKQKVEEQLALKNNIFTKLYNREPMALEEVLAPYISHIEKIKPIIKSTPDIIHEAIENNSNILFEGAQGTMLDIDWGTYPYVTSSNSSAAGLHSCTGVPLKYIDEVIGLTKAYTTRVGGGPFPTELDETTAQKIRGTGENIGDEYGSTTGRPRRCGWLDLFALKYAIKINSIHSIALSKIDMLDEFDTIKICTHYQLNGKPINSMPSLYSDLADVRPVYEELPGWERPVKGIKKINELPENAIKFIKFIEINAGVPIHYISTAPDREAIISLK